MCSSGIVQNAVQRNTMDNGQRVNRNACCTKTTLTGSQNDAEIDSGAPQQVVQKLALNRVHSTGCHQEIEQERRRGGTEIRIISRGATAVRGSSHSSCSHTQPSQAHPREPQQRGDVVTLQQRLRPLRARCRVQQQQGRVPVGHWRSDVPDRCQATRRRCLQLFRCLHPTAPPVCIVNSQVIAPEAKH